MAYEMKPDTGSLFENDKKDRDSQPDMKGKAKVRGKDVWVAGWWNESRNGPFLSLKFTEMTEEESEKYMGAVSSPRPDRSDLVSRVQERARKMSAENAKRMGRTFNAGAGIPEDDDIPF